MVSKFLVIFIATLFTLFSMTSAQTYSWKYSALSGPCTNSMCGLAYQTRTSQCLDQTGAVADPSFCQQQRGPPVNLMECFYSPPEGAKICGANYGSLAFDCVYNPQHDPADTSSPYQICKCKNDFTGDFCEIVPPNPPSPDPTPPPKPQPEPEENEHKDDKWKLWQYILAIFICAVLVGALVGAVLYFRKRKAQSSQVTPTPMENFPPSQAGYYEELDNAQA